MKKKLVIVAVIALLAVAALATVAYFSAQDTATNVITTGNVTMKLHEYQEIDGEKSPYPKDAVAAMPGTVISKIPTIENIGNNDFYTRAKVSVAFYADKDMKELVNLDTKYVTYDITKEWIDGGDGWYYYNGIVKPGQNVVLFNTVSFDKEMPNEYQNKYVKVDISTQAVQVKNNENSDVTKVVGWSE